MDAQNLQETFDAAVQASGEGRLDEAEAGFRAVLAVLPNEDEALFGLGLTLMNARRFHEAVTPLAQAADMAEADPVRRQCLAQALYMTGAFEETARAFAQADALAPLGDGARLTWARAAAYAVAAQGAAEPALALYERIAGPLVEPLETVAREGFAVSVAFNQLDTARALGAWLEAHGPEDAIRSHEFRVLVETDIDKAPPAYVEALFDAFAERFDSQLVDMLGYQAPEMLADLVATHGDRFERMLDLGCGTGLAAPHLRRFGGQLTGVDLSPAMLAKAAERDQYDDLIRAEAVTFLETQLEAFDLILATDVLIYFGDLGPLLTAASAALRPGGLLAVSTELGDDGWRLLPSARYAHGDAYLRAMAAPALELLDRREIPLRRDAAITTVGCFYVLRKT